MHHKLSQDDDDDGMMTELKFLVWSVPDQTHEVSMEPNLEDKCGTFQNDDNILLFLFEVCLNLYKCGSPYHMD